MVGDQLQRLVGEGAPVVLRTPLGVEVDGRFTAVDADRGRLTVELEEDPPPLNLDDAVRLYFPRNGQRWCLHATLHHFPKPTSLVLDFPKKIEAADRRQEPRAALHSGLVEAVVRTALYDGLVFHGPALSLSLNGFSFRVETVEGPGGTVPWRRGLLEPGRAFESVVLRHEGKEMEGEGRLLWVEGDHIGLRLRNLVAEDKERLAGLVRLHAFIAPSVLDLGKAPAAPLERPPTPGEVARDRSQALMLLKKRGRTLVLAMKAGHLREGLRTRLLSFGYGKVEVVDTLGQWLELMHAMPVDLVFIDGGVKELQGMELASFLHQSRGERNFSIVLAEQLEGKSLSLVARKAGVTLLLAKPYMLDAALDAQLEGALDLRPPEHHEDHAMPSARHKRKAIALVMPAGPPRDALQSFLLSEGFSRVLAAGTVGELVRALQSPTLGLVFVDWEEPYLPGMEVAAFLVHLPFATRPQILFAGDVARQSEEAHSLGIARVVPKGYALNAPLVRALLEAMEEMEKAG